MPNPLALKANFGKKQGPNQDFLKEEAMAEKNFPKLCFNHQQIKITFFIALNVSNATINNSNICSTYAVDRHNLPFSSEFLFYDVKAKATVIKCMLYVICTYSRRGGLVV